MIELSSCGRQQGKIKKVLDLYDLNSNIPVFRGNSEHDEIYRFSEILSPGSISVFTSLSCKLFSFSEITISVTI